MMIMMKIIHCSLLLLSVFLAPAYGQTIDECAATDPVVCYYNSKYDEYKFAVCTVYEKYGEFKNKTECVSPSKEDKLKGTITACGCCPDDDDASYCPITPSAPPPVTVTDAPVIAPIVAPVPTPAPVVVVAPVVVAPVAPVPTIDECAATDPVVCYYNSKYDEFKIAVCTVYEKYGEFKYQTECVSPSKEDKLKGTITACGCCPNDDDASYCPITPVTAAPVTAAPVTAAPVTAAPVTAAPVTAAPVTAAPVIPPTPCVDDPHFRFKQERDKTCEWVAEKPLQRCDKEWMRIDIPFFCPRACGLCSPTPAPSTPPSGVPSTFPTTAPVTFAPTGCDPELCFNDPDFKHKNCGRWDCDWVAKKTESRCYKKNNNQNYDTVLDSCPESCATSVFCLEVASKPGSEGCSGDNKYLCPITCGLCDLCPETSTRVSLKPPATATAAAELGSRVVVGGCPVHAPTTREVLCDFNPGIVGCTSVDITSIVKVNEGLTGTIPAEISELTALTELALNDNFLSGSIPLEFTELSVLEFVSLHDNQLTGTIPTQVGLMTTLTFLDFGKNGLQTTIPTEIGQLTALTYLDFSDYALSGTASIPSELGELTNLYFLKLDGNNLTGPMPSEIGLLTRLTSIDLSGNNLTGSIPQQFGNLSPMYCDLRNNQFTDSSGVPRVCQL